MSSGKKRMGHQERGFRLVEALEQRVLLQGEPTGLRPPTEAELAWEQQNLIVAQDVKLNELGLARLNADRAAEGLGPLQIVPVPLGQEIVGRTQAEGLLPAVEGNEAIAALPLSVDNSTTQYFPPIRTQGSQGSCAAFSATYYTMTYMTALARGWDVRNASDNSNKFSPKWTYNMINGGGDNGSWITTAYDVMLNNGCATWQQFPYGGTTTATDYRAWVYNNPSVWRSAINYRMNQSGSVGGADTATGLADLKTLLANGYVLNYATDVYYWGFRSINNDPATTADDAWYARPSHRACYAVYQQGTNPGGHAMTVVGYNDDIWLDINSNGQVDTGEKGAFRIANSWGNWWEDGGFVWLMYDSLKSVSAVPNAPVLTGREGAWWSNTAYWMTARTSYTPKVLAEFSIQHAKRDQVVMNLGLGGTTSSPQKTWSPAALTYDGGAYGFDGNDYSASPALAPTGQFVLDFTDLNPPSNATRYFVGFNDYTDATVGGTLSAFKVTRADGSAWAVCPTGVNPGNVPQSDAGAASIAYAYVDTLASDIVLERQNLVVPEGASASVNVKLASAPVTNVTVSAARLSGDSDVTVSGATSLLFTPANWDTWQTFTLAAAQDAGMTNDSTVIQLSASGLASAALQADEWDDDALYSANMDTNPGWALQGQWAWGQPTGGSGSTGAPDPTSGFSGNNVLGYNLSGGYPNSLTSTQWATSPAINCAGYYNVTLTFRRWLGSDYSGYDGTFIEASNNGTTWTRIWASNPAVDDGGWTLQSYNLGDTATGQPTVYVRFGTGPTNSTITYCGWNLDDLSVTGLVMPSDGQIAGNQWQDLNRDGRRDTGEPPAANLQVYLDLDDDGQLDNGEPSAWTDALGNYQFVGLQRPRAYSVRPLLPEGWKQTLPGLADRAPAKIIATGGYAYDYYGTSVAADGALAVIGADDAYHDTRYVYSGAAYLVDVATGLQLRKLLPSDGAGSDYFGCAVALDGNLVLIGAYGDDDHGSLSGSAYLFDRTTGSQLFKFAPADGAASDYFGNAVALAGNYALVGARYDDDRGSYSGAVYVFDTRTGQQLAKLTPGDGAAYDYFGCSLAVEGTRAVIGAYGDDYRGSVYVYDLTTFTQAAKLTAADGDYNDYFGASVALAGNTVLVGAYGDADRGSYTGSAYVFDLPTGQQRCKLTAFDAAASNQFGYAVDIFGDQAIVGAQGINGNAGAAYLFNLTTGRALSKFSSPTPAANAYFGKSVAFGAAGALVGAYGADTYSGAAYLYRPGIGGRLADLTLQSMASAIDFGTYPLDITPPTLLSAVSRKAHGSSGSFDLPLSLSSSTIEPRQGGPTKLIFNFSEPIKVGDDTLDAGNFLITNAAYNGCLLADSTLTLFLKDAVDSSRVTVTLNDFTDLLGNPLTGDSDLSVGVLLGDVNGNATVNINDVNLVKSKSGAVVDSTTFRYDVNANGAININDVNLVKSRSGRTLSAASPLSSATSLSAATLAAQFGRAEPVNILGRQPLRVHWPEPLRPGLWLVDGGGSADLLDRQPLKADQPEALG